MKRLILTLAAAAMAAGSPIAADLALAKDQGRREARDDRGRGRDRGPPPGWESRRGPPPERYRGPPPRWERHGPPEDRRRVLRPGRQLPQAYGGGRVDDYGRYRLRPPPHGYAWYRVGNDFLLVSLIDGQIFDIIVN